MTQAQMEKAIYNTLKKLLDNPDNQIEDVNGKFYEIKSKDGRLLFTLYREDDNGVIRSPKLIDDKQYPMNLDMLEKLLKYTADAVHKRSSGGLEFELSATLAQMEHYSK